MNNPVTKESLNEIATEYHLGNPLEDKEFDQGFMDHSYSWIKNCIADNQRVLEMGYGEGNFTEKLVSDGIRSDIVEGAELLVNEARSKYGSRVGIYHSMFNEFVPEEKYDVVLATNILEHVEDPVSVLRCIHNWLNPDGKVLITVPNSESLHRRLAVLMDLQPALDTLSPRDHIVGHLRVYSSDSLNADIIEAGFDIAEEVGFTLKVLPNSMMSEWPENLCLAMHDISPQLPRNFTANIGAVVTKTIQKK